jgi:sulfide:quinone oxidoreductase
VHWIKSAVAAFEPKDNAVILDGCRVVKYNRLVVCPGLKLDWDAVEGLEETLGRNGVTSNYRYDLAPYTWELVKGLKEQGRAIFTQPPMPIKCAGAPQKAMYLSGDALAPRGRAGDIDIQFMNAGGVLFGVKDYVPALRATSTATADAELLPQPRRRRRPGEKATGSRSKPDTEPTVDGRVRHDACLPAADRARLHPRLAAGRCRGLGRRGSGDAAPQDLREHLVARRRDERAQRQDRRRRAHAGAGRGRERRRRHAGRSPTAQYDGYGSCPLTVERGKIVLAEFGYGGALCRPSRNG